ncbi:uncharacterized protein Dvir_GJ26258 [Drosophila virilis]|uniref:Uncharacterized protein n=1 Tax=Drosophila virilis TaxID=7244 RepID=A0A0Q9WIF2_DROVI|nr:uncharacterized protein Dvir_GJ26258 [Drosophila virilis]
MDPPSTAYSIVYCAVVSTLFIIFGYVIYIIYTFCYGYAEAEFRTRFFALWANNTEADESFASVWFRYSYD